MIRIFTIFLIFYSYLLTSSAFDYKDKGLNEALLAASNGKWVDAEKYIKRSVNPATNAIFLNLIKVRRGKLGLKDAHNHIMQKGLWFPRGFFIADINHQLCSSDKPASLVNWFKGHAPGSNYHKLLNLDAKVKLGQVNLSNKKYEIELRNFWRNSINSSKEEGDFYKRYGKYFTVYDLKVKISEALWRDRVKLAKFLLNKLSHKVKDRDLYVARIGIATSPARYKHIMHKYGKYRNDDFIMYTHIKYLLKINHDTTALNLLKQFKPRRYFVKWWKLKHIAIRNAIRQKKYSEAYILTRAHNLSYGVDYSDAEWLAGWIKYRFLNKSNDAIKHFYRVYAYAKLATSKSKGAYWLGRVFSDLKDDTKMDKWFTIAANYKGYYYGQLALYEQGLLQKTSYITSHRYDNKSTLPAHAIKAMELAVLYYKTHNSDIAHRFVKQILAYNISISDTLRVMNFFDANKAYPLSVMMGKHLSNHGKPLFAKGYPLDIKVTNGLNKALYLALIRQESNFDQSAVSPVGATGLMQLMPKTACILAKQLHLPRHSYKYSAEANIAQGAQYVDHLCDMFGSYIITIASYNAGEGRGKQWIKSYGHPKELKTMHEIIDWVEQIPFGETRFYVKKVLENLTIYEYLLNSKTKSQKTLVDYLK